MGLGLNMHRTLTLILNLTQPDLTPEDGTNETESAEMDDDEQCFTVSIFVIGDVILCDELTTIKS